MFSLLFSVTIKGNGLYTNLLAQTPKESMTKSLTAATTLLLFFSYAVFISAFEFTEHNSVLLYCPLRSKADLDYLTDLQSKGHHIDIFEEKVSTGEDTIVKLLADPSTSSILLSHAGCFEEKSQSAVKRLFDIKVAAAPRVGPNFHDDYRSYLNIIDQLKYYAETFPQQVKAIKSIGKSHEGRDLVVIHLTAAKNNMGEKPLVWLMAGQHAREWIASSSALFFIEELLKPETNPALLDNFEFAIMPLVNPDGYEYSRTRNRMWRKNRHGFYGVDLNRNWDYKWCVVGKRILFYLKTHYQNHFILGGSRDAYRDNYCGTGPASEQEVSYTQNYILTLPKRFIGFDIHSYGQLILRNYAWTGKPASNDQKISALSSLMTKSIFEQSGYKYTAKPSYYLYPSSGSADDWLYVEAGIPGITIEMRDTGRLGFHLPSHHIKPAGMELFAAVSTAILNYKNESE